MVVVRSVYGETEHDDKDSPEPKQKTEKRNENFTCFLQNINSSLDVFLYELSAAKCDHYKKRFFLASCRYQN